MQQINWFDRKFDFSFEQNIFPAIIERLRGTTLRLKERTERLKRSQLQQKPENQWSILEQIGHLSDLEPLWQGRLEDIISGKEWLRVADLSNTQTHEANHNAMDLDLLLGHFSELRANTITRLENLSETQIYRTALHPRLKQPMRLMDLFLFVADHDDHHLAKITALIRMN